MTNSINPSDTIDNTHSVHQKWHHSVEKDYSNYIRKGGYMVGGVLLFFLVWSILAPIKGAAVAIGTVIADGNNSIIQHFEGGIIEKILVKEGDRVSKGQELILLDSTQREVQVNRSQFQNNSLRLQEVRLLAEVNLHDAVDWTSALDTMPSKDGIGDILDKERTQFDTRRQRFLAQRSAIENRIRATWEELRGNEASSEAARAELALVQNELDKLEYLFEKKLVTETRINTLRRTAVQLNGQVKQTQSANASVRARLAELEEQAIQIELEYQERAAEELKNVKLQIEDTEQVLIGARDTLDRVSVVSPKDGIIFRIPKKTPRAVISPGETVVELLPTSETLIIEARLDTNDIDLVSINQMAELRFSALSNRNPPIAEGIVTFISPDVVQPEDPSEPSFYPVRIKIDDASWPSEVDRSLITPGMNVDTFIITEARSLVSYLLEPITESASFALREP